jgi:hypothetical protein
MPVFAGITKKDLRYFMAIIKKSAQKKTFSRFFIFSRALDFEASSAIFKVRGKSVSGVFAQPPNLAKSIIVRRGPLVGETLSWIRSVQADQ